MSIVTVLLIVLVILAFSTGGFIGNGAYRGPGFSVAGLLVVVLVVLLVSGRL